MRVCKAYIFVLTLSAYILPAQAQKTQTQDAAKRPNKALCWLYRSSEWIDHYLLQGVDTDYITLPEHSWSIDYTMGLVGINSTLTADHISSFNRISILSHTTPSLDIGFNASYRGYGAGYSWDVLHAYSQKWNLSFGSKRFGLDFSRQTSANITGKMLFPEAPGSLSAPVEIGNGNIWITNTNLSVWYALNASHYSHQAAVKQSYIQKRTAGSLLLSLSYMSTDMSIHDSITVSGKPAMAILLGDVTHLITQQVAVGLGYGINYTPNKGKVLLHLSANAQLVCYSINHISIAVPDSIVLPGEPRYSVEPKYPVHVTGNIRAAVSWEINPWVHLSAWALANNIRFSSKDTQNDAALININNWNWQVRLTAGVRFGVGQKRVKKVLDDEEAYILAEEKEILRQAHNHRQDSVILAAAAKINAEYALSDSLYNAQIQETRAAAKEASQMSSKRRHRMRHTPLPKWITDYFYSPRYEKRN